MTWLSPQSAASITGHLLLVLVYGFLYLRYRDRFVGLWTLAWGAVVVRTSLEVANRAIPGNTILHLPINLSSLATAAFLLWGAYVLGQRALPWWGWALVAILAGGAVASSVGLLPPRLLALALGWYLVATFAWSGLVFARYAPAGVGRTITVVGFLAWSGSRVTLLSLGSAAYTSPWAAVIPSILSLTVALGTLLVYFDRLIRTLHTTERRAEQLVGSVRDLLYHLVLDPEPHLDFVSPSVERLTGYPVAEALTDPDLALALGSAAQRLRSKGPLTTLESGGLPEEVQLRHKDGSVRYLELLQTAVVANGRVVAVDGIGRDVTERRRTAEALHRSQSLFRGLLEHAAAVIHVKDLEGRFLHANPQFREIYQLGDDDIAGLTDFDLVDRESAKHYQELDARVLAEQRPIQTEERGIRHPDRTYLSLRFPLRDAAGRCFAIAGIATDITEVARARHMMEASQRMLRTVMDNVPQLLWWKDRNQVYLGCNARFAAHLGLGPKEVVGKADQELPWPPEEQAAIRRADAKVLNTGAALTHVLARSRGAHPVERTLWLDITRLPLHDPSGALIGVLGTAEDITERRRATEQLEGISQLHRAILDAAEYSIISTDPDGIIQTFNLGAERMLGYAAEDVVGRATPEMIHDREEVVARAAELSAELGVPVPAGFEAFVALARRGPADEREWTYIRKDGSRFPVLLSVTALRDATGAVSGFLGIASDLTHRRRLEAQLLQAQKLEAIGRLAGGVAHDFNNLLTAILGYTELLLGALPAGSAIQQDAEEIRLAAERATNLTKQLLSFARRQMIAPETMDLNTLVLRTDRLLRRLIGEHIDLVTIPGPNLDLVRIDPGQFEQILMNLAVNARDAMPSGGKLTVETRNVFLDEGMARQRTDIAPGPYVLLAVSDTGQGIDPETMHHIFEPFFTTKGQGEGVGLGLATCYGIVKQAGGSIWAYSEPSRGTTFKIYLPAVVHPQTTPEREPANHVALVSGTETILLVEDEPLVRSMGLRALQEQGYRVLEAGSGAEAMALASRHDGTIDLLVTDVVMPGMNGKDVASALGGLRPGIQVLFVSGYAEEMIVRHEALDPGLHFLAKPFTPLSLCQAVRRILDAPR